MSPARLELLLARERLRERIDHQRRALAAAAWPIRAACEAGDAAGAAGRWVRDHAGALGAGLLALFIVRPRGSFRWLRRGLFVWRLWKGLRSRLADVFGAR